MNWIKVSVWDNNIVLDKANGMTRLEVLRMLLVAARTLFFRWESSKPYVVKTETWVTL